MVVNGVHGVDGVKDMNPYFKDKWVTIYG